MSKKNIIINQVANVGRMKRKRNLVFDLIMIIITGGLWLIWMMIRPKYY